MSDAWVPTLAQVAAGEFLMGAAPHDKFATDTERPSHRVTFAHTWAIGRHSVTVSQFRAFNSACAPNEEDDLPVVNVSWTDACDYCRWLSLRTGLPFRLPSEAEWEYACRAGTRTPFATGDSISPSEANFLYSEVGQKVGLERRQPVGSYPPNALGLHDFHGNVCEWVEDGWHPNYDGAPCDGRAWSDSPTPSLLRVIRGGAWDYLPRLLRSSWRDRLPADTARDNVGFRVALTLES